MLEIEMKFPIADFRSIEEKLAQWQAGQPERREDADRYFNAPDRDFAQTDEALRLRSIGDRNFITYKGPKTDAQTKTRTELELPLPNGAAMRDNFQQLLQHLKYRFVALVQKRRTVYHLQRGGFTVEVCLDEVADLGNFVELEIVAPQEQLAAARAVLMELAKELNLTRSERRSYLQLLLGEKGMQVTATVAETRAALATVRAGGKSVGMVPTMGALHAGHVSLIRAARRETDFVAVSIFVNPTQFGPHEDFNRYPRPLEKDLELCRAEGVDLVFVPAPAEIYPPGFCTHVEVQGLQDVLEGASRPGHFRGVATVVLKLFNIVQPDSAYFGQKDAQQVRIIQQLIADLNVPVRIAVCPTVREPDGLALSSRNQYLDTDQRRNAIVLFQSLEVARQRIEAGEREAAELIQHMRQRIEAVPGARVDYVAAVDYATLWPVQELTGKVLLALAVYFGSTRLIDNLLMDLPAHLSPRSKP